MRREGAGRIDADTLPEVWFMEHGEDPGGVDWAEGAREAEGTRVLNQKAFHLCT